MKKNLYTIKGEETKILPFQIDWIGDLLYYGWSLISIYANQMKFPYVKIWVDASEEQERHILFLTTKKAIEGYLLQKITFKDFFSSAVNDDYYAVDTLKDTDDIDKITTLHFKSLNKKYLPDASVMFELDDAEEVEKIKAYFSLNLDLDNYLYGNIDISNVAKEKQTEVINIHLSSLNGVVGHGDIDSQVLGRALTSYNDMAGAAVLHIYEQGRKTKNQAKKSWAPGERDNVIRLAHTRFYAQAGSFDIYLHPFNRKIDKNGVSYAQQIADRIFDLFKMGDELTFVDVQKSDFPQEMLTAYEEFLKVIQSAGINASLQYGSPDKKTVRQEYFDSVKASKVIKKLKVIEKGTPIERKFTGTFSQLSKTNHTFEFTPASGNKLKGAFHKNLFDGLYFFVNLHATYQITVETQWENRSGRSDAIERNVIVSYIKV